MSPTGKKQCNVCLEILDLDEFDPHHMAKDGKKRTCRQCLKNSGKKTDDTPKPTATHASRADTGADSNLLQQLMDAPGRIIDGRMLLDLRDRTEIQDALQDAAHKEFRTLNGQVLYALSIALLQSRVLSCLTQLDRDAV